MNTDVILKFLMSKLSEADLAELDALLAGENDDTGVAQDAASVRRRDWLAMDARARHAVRKAKATSARATSDGVRSFAERFPDAANIRSV